MAGIVFARRGCRLAADTFHSGRFRLWSNISEKTSLVKDGFVNSLPREYSHTQGLRQVPFSYGFSATAVNIAREGNGIKNRFHFAGVSEPSFSALVSAAKAQLQCYFELSKVRLSLLVVTTASAGYVMGSPETVDFSGLAWTSLGTMMAAASANSLNQIFEISNDSVMKRTMKRPLPSGRMTRNHALVWAVSVGAAGISLLAYKANDLTAGLGAANIGLYAFLYTPLKQLHPINTWVGALVGALPPLMGWTAAAGQLDPGAYVLASALFIWQIPHFMALAWLCRNDYIAGGYKMLSINDATGRRTAATALRNCFYLAPLGFLAAYCGTTSSTFAYENLLLTAGMTAGAITFYRQPSTQSARTLFRYSLLYLPLFMTAMLVHRLPHSPSLWNVKNHSLSIQSGQLEAPSEDHFEEDSVVKKKGTRKFEVVSELEQEEKVNYGGMDWRGQLKAPPHSLPPVAFMSAAPFPFLPMPDYGSR